MPDFSKGIKSLSQLVKMPFISDINSNSKKNIFLWNKFNFLIVIVIENWKFPFFPSFPQLTAAFPNYNGKAAVKI